MTPKAFHALLGRIGERAKMPFPVHPHNSDAPREPPSYHCGNGCSFYEFETGEQIERCSYFFIVS